MQHDCRIQHSTILFRIRDWLRILGVVCAVLGLAVAAYMSYAELTGQETSCPGYTGELDPNAGGLAVDCGFVQHSVYAKLLGIPVADRWAWAAIWPSWRSGCWKTGSRCWAEYSHSAGFRDGAVRLPVYAVPDLR
jgi:hypothetical protein